MTIVERIARLEHTFLPFLSALPPSLAVRLFSIGRPIFLDKLQSSSFKLQALSVKPQASSSKPIVAFGLEFNLPIWNSAGMFKSGYGYDVAERQGAGAYVAGTTTSRKRIGNALNGIKLPAVPYSKSIAASNWLGLPNEGHAVVAKRLSQLTRKRGCPIGASVAAEPGLEDQFALPELADGMRMYEDANVDYLELNESCPNVERRDDNSLLDEGLIQRLEYISEKILKHRTRRLPVVVKFSVDTDPTQLEELLRVLVTLKYDGIILGNTSIDYAKRRLALAPQDHALYDHFTSTYGGGVSGAVLNTDSLALSSKAIRIIQTLSPGHEFHVIRCGGILSAQDTVESAASGVMLHQWYTGYFNAFALYGHNLYQQFKGA